MTVIRKNKGFVLVIVLWVIVILILMSTVLAQSSRLSSRVSQSDGRQCACRWGVRAAVETAIHVLREDDTSYDAFDELWYDNPDDFNDIQLEGCVVSVEVTDECGRLNVNTAGKDHFLHLLDMLPEQADSIIDWRDKDDTSGDEGAEAGYYNNLPYPYPIRNGPLQTLREILFIKGIREDLFYGEDRNLNGQLDANENDGDRRFPPDNQDGVLNQGIGAFLTCWSYCSNVDALGNARVNLTEASADDLQKKLNLSKAHAKWIEERFNGKEPAGIADLIDKNSPQKKNKEDENSDEAKPIDMKTFKDIADQVTISKEKTLPGRVNVNTASRKVLTALLEGDERLADEMINFRETRETPMTSIADLLEMKSMNVETFKKIAGMIAVRSDVFRIRARAVDNATGLIYSGTAIVSRNDSTCNIIYWYEGIGN